MPPTRYTLDPAHPAEPPPRRDAVRSAVNRLVRARTGNQLSDLHVDVGADVGADADGPAGRDAAAPDAEGPFAVVLTGRCDSFYCKQLAGVAAMAAAPGGVVRNRIAVT